MPELEKVRAEFEPRGVQFLALSIEPDAALVGAAAMRLGVKMKVATTEQQVLDPFSVKRTPSTVWIDEHGRIVAAASGERSGRFLQKRTRELLDD